MFKLVSETEGRTVAKFATEAEAVAVGRMYGKIVQIFPRHKQVMFNGNLTNLYSSEVAANMQYLSTIQSKAA